MYTSKVLRKKIKESLTKKYLKKTVGNTHFKVKLFSIMTNLSVTFL